MTTLIKTQMEQSVASPVEIAEAIKEDILIKKGIKLADAARILKTSPQSLHGILKGKAPYRPKTAKRFHEAFGYSIEFMLEGKGSLYEEKQTPPPKEDTPTDPRTVTIPLEEYMRLCEIKNAVLAFAKLLQSDIPFNENGQEQRT